jgi:hypothetical protein
MTSYTITLKSGEAITLPAISFEDAITIYRSKHPAIPRSDITSIQVTRQ